MGDGSEWSAAGLWLAVIVSGLYHGLSPGMGWPLAVSAGLMEKSSRALLAAFWPISLGHLAAMLVVMLPFVALLILAEWRLVIQMAAGLVVMTFGLYKLIDRRHPRALARIKPTELGLWSFAVAVAHGAGLMLVPIYLGLCRAGELDAGHRAAEALMLTNLQTALTVAVAHTLAMLAGGAAMAWLVYRYLGLKALSRSWFNLEAAWAASLVLVGAIAVAATLLETP